MQKLNKFKSPVTSERNKKGLIRLASYGKQFHGFKESIIGKPDQILWDRLCYESSQAFEAFCVYRDLGSGRSLIDAAKLLNKSGSAFQKWSTLWGWVERVKSYEEHLNQVIINKQIEAREEMIKRHVTLSKLIQQKLLDKLNELKEIDIDVTDIPKFLDISTKLERLSLGESTEKSESVGELNLILSSLIDRIQQRQQERINIKCLPGGLG